MLKRLSVFLCLLLTVSACTETPTTPEYSESDVILDRLHLVKNARVGMAYVDPDADFSRYGKIMLDPLDTSRTEIVQPPRSAATPRSSTWELTDTDRDALQKAFREVFTKELEETGDYAIVTEPGPDVLRLTATITQLAPAASKDDTSSRSTGRSRVYTEGAGSMSIAFGLSDSQSGEVLAVVKDARRGSPVWGVNNSVTNLSDVRFMFSRWARMLRARLDIAHGY